MPRRRIRKIPRSDRWSAGRDGFFRRQPMTEQKEAPGGADKIIRTVGRLL